MTELLQDLIEGLREELKQYGEMLALLEKQQELVVQRLAADLLQTVAAVDAQGTVIRAARQQREEYQSRLARHLQQPADAALATLAQRVPPDYRPLLTALVQENNQLLFRVQQRARQNHLLLNRSLELMQRFISSFFPANAPTYNETGGLLAHAVAAGPLYEAVG